MSVNHHASSFLNAGIGESSRRAAAAREEIGKSDARTAALGQRRPGSVAITRGPTVALRPWRGQPAHILTACHGARILRPDDWTILATGQLDWSAPDIARALGGFGPAISPRAKVLSGWLDLPQTMTTESNISPTRKPRTTTPLSQRWHYGHHHLWLPFSGNAPMGFADLNTSLDRRDRRTHSSTD